MVRLQMGLAPAGVVALSRPARKRPIIIGPNMINKSIIVATGENARKSAVYRECGDDLNAGNQGVEPERRHGTEK